jgi:hypothetical protein
MQKILIILLIGLLTPFVAKSQRTRVASCANQQSARWYFMPYAGVGMAWYSYNLNGTVMDTTGYTYDLQKSGTIPTYYAGLMFLHRFDGFNLGIGGEWQVFSGTSDNGYTQMDIDLYYIKAYGRFELPIYSSSFSDFGFYGNLGAIFPYNAQGTNVHTGFFLDLGMYYNIILTESSSLFLGMGYQQSNFQTTIGNAVSKHKQNGFTLSAGYRIWF